MAYRGQSQGSRRGGKFSRGGGGNKGGQPPPQMPHLVKDRGSGGFKSRRGNRGSFHWKASNLNTGRVLVDEDGDESMGGEQGGDGRVSRRDFVARGGRGGRGGVANSKLRRLGLPINSDSSRPTWFKIMMPFCAKVTESYLIQLLRQNTTQDFTPLNFKTEGKQAAFFVKTKTEADALRSLSGNISLADGYKVKVMVQPQLMPDVESLTADQLNLLKEVMSSRYDVATRALNLSKLADDDRFKAIGLVLNLAKPGIMKEIAKVIMEHIPEVVSVNISNNFIDQRAMETFGTISPIAVQLKSLDISYNKVIIS